MVISQYFIWERLHSKVYSTLTYFTKMPSYLFLAYQSVIRLLILYWNNSLEHDQKYQSLDHYHNIVFLFFFYQNHGQALMQNIKKKDQLEIAALVLFFKII